MEITDDTKRKRKIGRKSSNLEWGRTATQKKEEGQTTPRLFDKPQGILLSYIYLKLHT